MHVFAVNTMAAGLAVSVPGGKYRSSKRSGPEVPRSQSYSGAGRGCPGYLLAYKLDSATGALTWIWPSSMTLPPVFEPAPFAIPTAVNGYVYAPAYGLYDSANSKYDISGVQAYVF